MDIFYLIELYFIHTIVEISILEQKEVGTNGTAYSHGDNVGNG